MAENGMTVEMGSASGFLVKGRATLKGVHVSRWMGQSLDRQERVLLDGE